LPVWPFDFAQDDDVPGGGSVVVEIYTAIAAMAGGRSPGRSKMKTMAELIDALAAVGSPPAAGHGPSDDHRSDALLAAAWLRAVADRPELWHPQAMTREIAVTEGWTFGAV
jgi:hypothetical protein